LVQFLISMKIKLADIKNYIYKRKKPIVIGVFAVGYILFWFWYFGERDIAIKDSSSPVKQEESVVQDENKNDNKKEFSQKDLGNFWLEINTDKIKTKAPILEGIEPEVLNKGLGRHRTTALPGQNGNMVISGHRWKFGNKPSYKVFENLDKLKNGDKIKVHYGGKVFEYEVYEKGVVSPNKKGGKEILKKTSEPILTLYTCAPKYTAWKRLYYRARLVSIENYRHTKQNRSS